MLLQCVEAENSGGVILRGLVNDSCANVLSGIYYMAPGR